MAKAVTEEEVRGRREPGRGPSVWVEAPWSNKHGNGQAERTLRRSQLSSVSQLCTRGRIPIFGGAALCWVGLSRALPDGGRPGLG